MYLVSPKLPTVLNDQTAVELPGYDLLMVYNASPSTRSLQ